jgi:PAS domain S-box-containing protein
MEFQFSPYILPLIGAAIVSGWIAAYVWTRRSTRSAPALTGLALAVMVWSLGYALEIAGANLATKLFWGKVQYIGIVTAPLLWFIFAYNHASRDQRMSHRAMLLASIIPFITLVLVFTTDLHGLVWQEIGLRTTVNFSLLQVTYGPWFWIHSVYSYTLLLAGAYFIVRSVRHMWGPYRGQAVALLMAMAAPWIGNIVYLSDLSPIPYLDPTPFAFTISIIALVWGIFGFRLMDLSPVARDMVVEEMSEGMVVLDAQARIADINPAAEQLLAISAAQAIGRPMAEVLRAWPQVLDRFGGILETSDEITVGSGDTRRWYEVRISPLKDRRQRVAGRVITVRNITARKQVEERLLEERNLLRTVIDNVPDQIFVRDRANRFILSNLGDARAMGVDDPEILVGKTDYDFYPPEQATQFQADNQAVMQSGQPLINREERVGADDHDSHWVLTTKVPLRDRQGDIIGLVGVSRDITARKQADEQIRQLSRAVEASPVSIVITDTRGSIQYVNPKFTEVTGYTYQEALGQNPSILKSGLTPQEIYRQMWSMIETGQEWHGEFSNRKKNGELYWEWASISPIMDSAGHISHYVAVKEDITERKRAQEELADARDQALAASRYKTELMAKVSHELRTPLGAIMGYAEFLHKEMFAPLTSQQKHFTGEILDSVNYLNALVNDLLDEAQIERGKIQIQPALFSLRQMVDQLTIAWKPAAQAKGLEFSLAVAPELPANLFGDQKRIRQILTNLIGNAVKFTTAGSVTAQLQRPDPQQWSIQVTDTGPGMSPEVQAKIFEAFWQADGSPTRQHKGYGLGLSIVKQLTDLMGGEISVQSEVNLGSTFCVVLPISEPTENQE